MKNRPYASTKTIIPILIALILSCPAPASSRSVFSDITRQIGSCLKNEGNLNVAVVGINTIDRQQNQFTVWCEESLTAGLAANPDLHVLERGRIQAVMTEQKFGLNDLADPQNAIEVGRLLSAQALICGSITQIGKNFNFNLRVVDTKTGEILPGCGTALDIRATPDLLAMWEEIDNRPLMVKIKAACLSPAFKKSPGGGPDSGGYKTALPFARQLFRQGAPADAFSIQRRDGLWYIDICGKSWWIAPDVWFKQFCAENADSTCLRLSVTPGNHLASGDNYFIKVTALASGYVSLFHVTETGQVLRLLLNRPVTAGQTLIYPDKSQYTGLVADAENFDRTRDLVIGVWCAEPLADLGTFMAVNENFLKPGDERSYSYGQLIDAMQDHCWVSCFVHIRK